MSFYGQRIYESSGMENTSIIQGQMNEDQTKFIDIYGNEIIPNLETIYIDINTFYFYFWNDGFFKKLSQEKQLVVEEKDKGKVILKYE